LDKLDNLSIPARFELNNFEDDRYRKITVWVMHDKLNLNNSYFDFSAIEDAKSSLENVPILAFIKQIDGSDDLDFGGHEFEMIITQDNIRFRYLGRPIGIIPSENNYRYETIDEKLYVVVDGYIWTDYANEALDILERDIIKSHSMEVKVDKYSYDNKNKYTVIDKYRYTGLTLLGDNITPAMVNSKAELFTIKEFNNDYFTKVEELNILLKNNVSNFNKEGGNELREEITALLQKYSLTQEQVLEKDSELNFEEISVEDLEAKLIEFTKVEEVVEPEVESNPTTDFTEDNIENALNNPESEPETNFSLTATQLVEEIRKVLMTRVVVAKDWWGDSYEAQEFYYRDIKDDLVIVIDNEWINYYGIPLTTNEDTVILDFENKIPYMADWRPKVEGDASFSFEIFEIMKERALARTVEIQSVDTTEFTTKIESLEKEVQELTEFKLDIQKQEKLDLVDKFTELTDEEKAVFIENIDTYSLEDLEIKLFAEIGKKKINYTVETVKPTNLIFSIPKTTGGDAPAWVEMVEQYKAKNNK